MFVEISSQRIPLDIGQLYMLGKQINGIENKAKNFIKLNEGEDVEDKHCVIEVGLSEDVCVYDLFSSKGTLVNDKPLKALEKLRLKNGDILKVGNQEVKYFNEQEVSHDSSGFLEVNKNSSDIITSSPDSMSEHESRIKRIKHNNFLVPAVPLKKSITPNKSLVIPETEANYSRKSLNASTASNNRRSDSFTIPETQYCRRRDSLNGLDLSIAESIADVSVNKIKFNFGNLDELEDDEFCIPETQEVVPAASITSSQRRHNVVDAIERSILLENPSKIADDSKQIDGSQFRICTQDYNEGFGEEAEVGLHSEIIPLIKHNTVILNNSSKSCKENSKNKSKIEEEDKEMSALKWSNSKIETTAVRADCSTPDIFDFGEENVQQQVAKENGCKDKTALETAVQIQNENEYSLLSKQVFPSANAKPIEKESLKDVESPCVEKENEEVLTLSDKENFRPLSLEALTYLPPTQLFATNEAPLARSTISAGSSGTTLKTNTTLSVENRNYPKSLLNIDSDEEDYLLTQIFLQPTTLPTTSSHKDVPVKCFNSTVLEDKIISKNPALFFAEMEKTALKKTPASPAFKMPQDDFLMKSSSATSATSETDLDLLMCTPQLIKQHLHVDKTEDLRKNILAVKNRHLFGNDTDEDETEEDDGQSDLVKLINIPKDSLDFDKLLPHLKTKPERIKISEEQKAAEEARKQYKFNLSFGNEIDEKQTKSTKSSTLSRDERHVARDKERELAEHKERTKTKGGSSHTKGKTQQRKTRQTKSKTIDHEEDKSKASEKNEDSKQKEPGKQERTTCHSKRQASNGKTEKAKEHKMEEPTKLMPARRITRAKSRLEEEPSTNKESAKSKKTKNTQDEGDDLDSISTQAFARVTRCSSSSKQSESQDRINSNSSNSSVRKTREHNKSKNDSVLSHNASANGNISTKASSERKRKAESTPPIATAKIERKRLRSTHSLESSTTHSSYSSPVNISITMVNQELFKNLVKNCKGFWNIAKNPADSDVLVMNQAFRTFKFLLAMARGIPIVTSEYLKQMNEAQSAKNVQINDYLFANEEFEKKHKFSLVNSLQMAKKRKLFKGYEFLMTASILPNPQEIKAIIEASGGLVHVKLPPAPKENQQIYLITSKEDKKDWHKYRRLNKNIVIVSTEAIMSAVMRQTCECMSSYTLT